MMEQQKQTENNAPIIDINFNLIRNWIKEHLKEAKMEDGKNLIRSEGRTVVINTIDGQVRVDIPSKDDPQAWAASWISVYETSLNALEAHVESLARKSSYIRKTHDSELDKLIVGDRVITLPEDINSIPYARTLETIIKETELYESKMQEQQKKPIVFNCTQIVLDAPGEVLGDVKPEEKVEKKVIVEKPKNAETKVIIGQKISDNEKISEVDCSNLRGQAFVLATWLVGGKGEDLFYKNCDMLKENLPSVPLGAFINGKASDVDHAFKESTKLSKVLYDVGANGPVIYEINNEFIKENADKPEAVIAAVDTAEQIADVLSSKQYKVLLCMDFDVSKILQKINEEVRPDYIQRYPQAVRILPREKDEVDPKSTAVIMDPQYDNDQVIVKDGPVIGYLEEILKETEPVVSPEKAILAA